MGKISVSLDQAASEEYREKGYWGDATLLDYWEMSVKAFPEKIAAADYQGKRYTFRALDAESDRVAAYLVNECGVELGDVVSIQVPNWVEFTLAYIACLKAGAVINPLMPKFKENELLFRMGKCHTKVLFCPRYFQKIDYVQMIRKIRPDLPDLKRVVLVDKETCAPQSAQAPDFDRLCDITAHTPPLVHRRRADADDVAIILFTSGTESVGKGVMLTHNNMAANMKSYVAMTQLCSVDAMLMPVPVAHATGLMYGITIPFMVGMKSVLLDSFHAESSLALIARERCTAIEGPTVIAHDIIHYLDVNPGKYDISSLKYFFCGGSPIPRTIVEKGLQLKIRILGVYGSTESAPHCIVAPYHPMEKVLTSDGCVVPGMEIKVVDGAGKEVPPWTEGEELSRGPNVFVGYLGEPEMTKNAFDNGWFRSGDLCCMDSDGYIRITGRKKDVIIRGGENVSSVEVEGVLMLHPNVKEAAVVAYPDERLGEKACAYIALRSPDDAFDLAAVQAHMQAHGVAKYKWPERLELVSGLPKTDSGKIQKFKLREAVKKKLTCKKELEVPI